MASRSRRSSLPAIKLSGGHSAPPRTLSAISDCAERATPEPPKKCSSLDNLGKEDRKVAPAKARRHSVVAISSNVSSNRSVSSPKGANQRRASFSDTNSLVETPRRHSIACIDSGKEALLKKRLTISDIEEKMKEDIAEEQEKESVPQAWTPGRRGSVDRDLPDGSDIFQLAMADFIPEEEEVVTITTIRLKDCSDIEDEDSDSKDDGRTNGRRIRWSKEVSVIS